MSDRVELPTTGGGPGGERCETCYFWELRPGDTDVGDCKRFPPKLLPQMVLAMAAETGDRPAVIESRGYVSPWGHPAREPDDWCGEWRAKAGAPPKPRTWAAYTPPVIRDDEMSPWFESTRYDDAVTQMVFDAMDRASIEVERLFKAAKGNGNGFTTVRRSIQEFGRQWCRLEDRDGRRRTPTAEAVQRVLATVPDPATLVAIVLAEDAESGRLTDLARKWLTKAAEA